MWRNGDSAFRVAGLRPGSTWTVCSDGDLTHDTIAILHSELRRFVEAPRGVEVQWRFHVDSKLSWRLEDELRRFVEAPRVVEV